MTVKIRKAVLVRIFLDAEKRHPYEACGILAGKIDGVREIERVYTIKNVHCSSVEYEMDPEELYRTLRRIEEEGLNHLGFYHSHPFGDSVCSTIDEEKSKLWEGYLYLIVSLKYREYTCYLKNGKLKRQEIIVMH